MEDLSLESLDGSVLQGNTVNSTTLPNKIANVIMANVPFARDPSGKLYYFNGGRYYDNGERQVEILYKTWLRQNGAIDQWRDNMGVKIVKYILHDTDCKLLWEKPPLEVINLKNGLYDWNERMLQPHSPTYLSTVQIPVYYDDKAECPVWDEFLHDVLPVKGGADYLRQVIALCLTPFTGVQKCIVLVGEGSNGKSTFLNALQKVVGLENVSNIPFHQLTNPLERFVRAGIVGKLVNIFGDMSRKKVEDAGNFKALVGEDRMMIENKHRDPYYYVPFCKLIFSCNEVVSSDDSTAGYKRRFVHIPFTQKFTANPQKGLELAEKLQSKEEMSGLFNKVLPHLSTIIHEGLKMSPEVASIIDDWVVVPDNARTWIKSVVVGEEGAIMCVENFYSFFTRSVVTESGYDHTTVVKYMRHLFPGVRIDKATRRDGRVVDVFIGVRTKSKEMGDAWLDPSNLLN